MATPTDGDKLSLGKLGRATAVGNSDYTSKTSLNDAGRDSGTAKTKISDFYVGAVDSTLDGYPYVDEQTNETYEVTFTNSNTLFDSRVRTRAENFTWTTNNASLFNMNGTQDYTTQYNAGAITDSTTIDGVVSESNLVLDHDFNDWSDVNNLVSWSGSADAIILKQTLATQSPSGSNDFAVKFLTEDSYISQSFTVAGNSTYQIRAMASSSNTDEGNIDLYISGAYSQQTFRGFAGNEEWNQLRDDFYTSGSAGVNQTLMLQFTAISASSTHKPLLDSVFFERWEGAHFSDTNVTITGKYHDDGQSDGFNDQSTRYNTAISKTVEIQDTYAGQSIACFLPGTMIQMSDGSEQDIEDINIGDEVLSVVIPNLPDEDLGYSTWKSFESTDDMTNLEVSSATIEHIFYDYMDGYWDINDGLVKVTSEHDFWTYTGKKWEWCTPKQLSVGNSVLDYQGNLIEITSLESVEGEVEVINFDVEPLDVYYAGGVLVHNKGASSEP